MHSQPYQPSFGLCSLVNFLYASLLMPRPLGYVDFILHIGDLVFYRNYRFLPFFLGAVVLLWAEMHCCGWFCIKLPVCVEKMISGNSVVW